MKSQKEITAQVKTYREQLALAIEEKAEYNNKLSPDIDLVIFSLVDKLEILFWVLDIELPEGDMIDRLNSVNH